jgi:Xaa-Pro dipeptidase
MSARPYNIPATMFAEQRRRLGAEMKRHLPAAAVAVFQGASEIPINSTDCNYLFRNDSYFHYLFGYNEPDCVGAVFPGGYSILFIPRLPESYAVWMGKLPAPEDVKESVGVDEVHYTDEVTDVLKQRNVEIVHIMDGVNSDSGLKVIQPAGLEVWKVDRSWLFDTVSELRVIKTDEEKDLLKYVCKVSSDAHIEVMRNCRPGMSQHQLESMFLHHVYFHGGCRRVSYTCICATGHFGAILHYPNNDAPILDGTMALLDMGGAYQCYASDITCSFPVNGKFTPDQKAIYNAVLDAHDSVLCSLRPGVSWVDMHLLALRTVCKHLIEAGILIGEVDDLMSKQVMYVFQPHGMGHLIGLDVHDVGGYLSNQPRRPEAQDCCRLRFARALCPGMYVTVEPGCYFNHVLLEGAFRNPNIQHCFNEKLIRERFWMFGGVRIESDVFITSTGAVNFTCVPRTVGEIEAVMSGQSLTFQIKEHINI